MKYKYIYMVFAAMMSFALTSCFSDETTIGDRELSEITIVEGTVEHRNLR